MTDTTEPPLDDLCERLMKVESSSRSHSTVTTCWYRNPDGPEAAARIQSDAATIAELRQENARVTAAVVLLRSFAVRMQDAWEGAVDLGIVPEQHRNDAEKLADACWLALAATETKP